MIIFDVLFLKLLNIYFGFFCYFLLSLDESFFSQGVLGWCFGSEFEVFFFHLAHLPSPTPQGLAPQGAPSDLQSSPWGSWRFLWLSVPSSHLGVPLGAPQGSQAPWRSPGFPSSPGRPKVISLPRCPQVPRPLNLAGLLRHLGALVPWSIQSKR